jgi:Flp pilus assembly pilin Flp
MLPQIMQLLRNLRKDDKGVTAIEYGLIAAMSRITFLAAEGS